MANERLLVGVEVRDLILVSAGGSPVLSQHEKLAAILARQGAVLPGLFAKPEHDAAAGAPIRRVTWYGQAIQDPVPLRTLDGPRRLRAEALLRSRFEAMRPLLSDPEAAPLLRAALLLRGEDDILWGGDAPVLVNWVLVPAAIGSSAPAQAQHFAATLGRYAPAGFDPWHVPVAGLLAAGVTAAGAAAGASAVGAPLAAAPGDARAGGRARGFLGATAAASPMFGSDGQGAKDVLPSRQAISSGQRACHGAWLIRKSRAGHPASIHKPASRRCPPKRQGARISAGSERHTRR
ncbi:MAG: hypothetical protein ACK52G_18745 [Betaproteobacteria bacterium]